MGSHAKPNVRMLSKGFWLPLGRSNFFNPEKDRLEQDRLDRDRELLKEYNGNDAERPGELRGYLLKQAKVSRKRLQSSAFYRLVSVVGSDFDREQAGALSETFTGKRYSCMFPLFDAPREPRDNMPDPVGVIFTCQDWKSSEWAKVQLFILGVALAVQANGFYVWNVLYRAYDTQEDNPLLIEDTEERRKEEETRRYHLIDAALDEHMERMIGKGFFSHYSERKDKEAATRRDEHSQIPAYELKPSLKTYQDEDIGILNFFQLDILLEGLYNYNFDPRIFFDNGVDNARVERVQSDYSLDNFIYLVRTKVLSTAPTGGASILDDLSTLIDDPQSLADQGGLQLLQRLHRDCFDPQLRHDLLKQFFRKTSTSVLHIMKWRVESCSKNLLDIMIEIAHLRRPFLQADVPDTLAQGDEATQDRYLITNANEAQLRGYVMLLAAKIPLFMTVSHYLQNNLDALESLDELQNPKTEYRKSLRSVERSWQASLLSIQEDIKGLENAIEQAYMDQMLDETEKLRSEQENIAEIERIRDRTSATLSPASNLTVSIIANILTLAGLTIAVALGGNKLLVSIPFLKTFESQSTPIVILELFGALLVLVVAYSILQLVLNFIFRSATRLINFRRKRQEERYYYEMDLGLNARIGKALAFQLMQGDFPRLKPATDLPEILRAMRPRERPFVERWNPRKPERSSFRVNRASQDQALFKIYVDAFIIWPRRWLPNAIRNVFTRQHMRIFLVYEILYHTPSGVEEHKIRNVRVVSNTGAILSPERLAQLRALVAYEFINRWVDNSQDRIKDGDAALALNSPHEKPIPQAPDADDATRTSQHGKTA